MICSRIKQLPGHLCQPASIRMVLVAAHYRQSLICSLEPLANVHVWFLPNAPNSSVCYNRCRGSVQEVETRTTVAAWQRGTFTPYRPPARGSHTHNSVMPYSREKATSDNFHSGRKQTTLSRTRINSQNEQFVAHFKTPKQQESKVTLLCERNRATFPIIYLGFCMIAEYNA